MRNLVYQALSFTFSLLLVHPAFSQTTDVRSASRRTAGVPSPASSAACIIDQFDTFIDNQRDILDTFVRIANSRKAAGETSWDNVIVGCADAERALNKADAIVDELGDLAGLKVFRPSVGQFSISDSSGVDIGGFLCRAFDHFNNLSASWLSAAEDLEAELNNLGSPPRKNILVPQEAPHAGGLPEAEYFIREERFPPPVTGALTLLVGLTELIEQAMDSATEQEISITVVAVGGGGVGLNVSIIQSVPASLSGIVKLIAETMGFFDDTVNGAEVLASYQRLGFLNSRIDYLDRIDIEKNLSGHGEHPHPVASYQLPEAFGGHLAQVRQVVRETIDDMIAAGEGVHKAEKWFKQGDQQRAAGRYKQAYASYSRAYSDATRLHPGHHASVGDTGVDGEKGAE